MKSKQLVAESSGDDSIYHIIAQLWKALGEYRRKQFVFLLGVMVLAAFAEIISLGAVLPFIGVMTDPERIMSLPTIARLSVFFHIESAHQLVLPLTISFMGAAIFSAVLRIWLLRLSTSLGYASGSDISSEVYRRTLLQPYSVHVARNSSEVISGITSKVSNTTVVINSCLTFTTSILMLFSIVAALLVINPIVAIMASLGFGLIYAVISSVSRKWLRENSKCVAREQTQVIKALQEGLGGIRDVLLDSSQSLYCQVYQRSDKPLRAAQGRNMFIGQSPRYAMEAVGMILLAGLAYGLSLKHDGLSSELPALGALALGAQRLLPALQQIYSSWALISGERSAVSDVLGLLEQPIEDYGMPADAARVTFQKAIRLENIQFKYSSTTPDILKDFTLDIFKGSRIGIIGKTGSGKSTVLDVFMGLLEPTSGRLLIDGKNIKGELLKSWQKNIAHVPQSIFLADATLAENIAFGVSYSNIDFGKVREAARQAQIAEFIESREGQYDALVGERGIRLSGGQRQRIGIARALYKEASVLVFDEATSALDATTERELMEAIEGLKRDLTIIIVAHRLSTVSGCDFIIELKHGSVFRAGSSSNMLNARNYEGPSTGDRI